MDVRKGDKSKKDSLDDGANNKKGTLIYKSVYKTQTVNSVASHESTHEISQHQSSYAIGKICHFRGGSPAADVCCRKYVALDRIC
jgi:hypothetical protein